MKYDIFISYRKSVSGDKAEMIQQLLEFNGYKGRVSYDRDNLRGEFSIELIKRIDSAKDFLMLIVPDTFLYVDPTDDKATEFYSQLVTLPSDEFIRRLRALQAEGRDLDYVRIELGRALHCAKTGGLNIVPITLQSGADFAFSKLSLPQDLSAIKNYQAVFFSTADEARFKDILPDLKRMMKSRRRRLSIKLLAPIVILTLIAVGWIFYQHKHKERVADVIAELSQAPNGDYLTWSDNVTLSQAEAVRDMLSTMIAVDGGNFVMGASDSTDYVDPMLEMPTIERAVSPYMIGKYEVSVDEYNRIMGIDYKEPETGMPKTDVSYNDCIVFITRLNDMTDLNFRLPTEAEWEYAARGGAEGEDFYFSGSNDPDEVAWYKKNSGGRPHGRDDHNVDLGCNSLDLYDMSGNVAELCDTPFRLYSDADSDSPEIINENAIVLRGGAFSSNAYDVTVTHREPVDKDSKASTIGFRLVLDRN